MLELSTLVFKVDTAQLTEAIKKTNDLAQAQKGLATAMVKGSGTGGAGQQTKKVYREQQDLLTKLDNLYKDLAQGATRWEASQLRAARQMGVPLEAVREQLVGIRKLSQDPFDAAIGSVRSITQYFEQLQNRISLANEGLILTAKQMREFSRIPFEVEGQMRAGGKDPKGADNGDYLRRIEEEERKYIDTARAANKLADAEKERANVLKQNAQASKFLATEMQRVDAVLAEMNNEFGLNASTGERSAAAVAKYATALQRAGVSGVEAASKLETYRNKVQQIAMQDEKRAATRLSRALTPQISDVAVSVAGGMPLHLIIMQQGLQIRDLIAQSGVAQKTLQGVFKTAAADMVSSIGGTITALGSLTFGALTDAGAAVNRFAGKITGTALAIDALTAKFPNATAGLASFSRGINAVAGVALGGAVVAIGALTYEYFKLIGASNDLTRALALSGGSFNVNYESSSKYIAALRGVGVTTRDATQVISEMASSSKLIANQITMVGKSAVEMEKYTGVAISDTVKSFDEMAKSPVETLVKLAIKTGEVSPEVVKLARSFEEQGMSARAAALGVEALANVNASSTKKMQQDLHPVLLMYKELKSLIASGISGAFSVDGIFQSDRTKTAVDNYNKIRDITEDIARDQKILEGAESRGVSQGNIQRLQDKIAVKQKELTVLRDSINFAGLASNAELRAQEERSKTAAADQKLFDARSKYDRQFRKDQEIKALDAAKLAGLSEEAYKIERKRIEDSYQDKKLIKEINKERDYKLSIDEKINDVYGETVGKVKEETRLQALLRDLKNDPKFLALKKEEQKVYEDRIKSLDMESQILVQRNKIQEDYIRGRKELAELDRAQSKHGAEYERRIAAIQDLNFRGVISDEDFNKRMNDQMPFSDVKKSSDKTTENIKSERDKMDVQRADLDFEKSMVGRTERVRQEAQIQLDLKKRFLDIEADARKQTLEIEREQEGAYRDKSLSELKNLTEERKRLAQEEAEFKTKLLSDEIQRQKNFDDTLKRGFESMGDALIDFAVTGKSSFGDMIKQMLIDFTKLEMRLQMMKLYEGARGGSSGGMFGGLLGNVFGGTPFGGGFTDVGGIGAAGSSALSSILGGFFANGGNPPMGKVSVVGEQGPELFIPKQQGTIIPNHQLGGTKKVVNMNQTYNIQIDSRSDQASIYAGVQSMLKQNNAQLVDSLQTGGYL